MKKTVLVFATAIVLVSCSSREEKLISRLETHLVNSLKDPSSYERIEAKLDTVYAKEFYKRQLETAHEILRLSEEIAAGSASLNDTETWIEAKKEIKDTKELIVEYNKKMKNAGDEIKEIAGVFKYRAKNGFGALDIHTQKVWYRPDSDTVAF